MASNTYDTGNDTDVAHWMTMMQSITLTVLGIGNPG